MGGAEADPVTEMMVLEQLAYHDLTSGWCTMVGATAIASLGTFLPQSGLAKVFADGHVPTAAISFFPPDAPCATGTVFVLAAVGGSIAAFVTRSGSWVEQSSKERKPGMADDPS